jgi:hypothetical protein
VNQVVAAQEPRLDSVEELLDGVSCVVRQGSGEGAGGLDLTADWFVGELPLPGVRQGVAQCRDLVFEDCAHTDDSTDGAVELVGVDAENGGGQLVVVDVGHGSIVAVGGIGVPAIRCSGLGSDGASVGCDAPRMNRLRDPATVPAEL